MFSLKSIFSWFIWRWYFSLISWTSRQKTHRFLLVLTSLRPIQSRWDGSDEREWGGGQGTAAPLKTLCTRTCVSRARAARAAGRGWCAAPLCHRFFAPASIIRGPFGFLNGINFSVDFTWQAAQRSRRREIISLGPRRYRCPSITQPLRPVVELESSLP